jgi:hypothetical protein
MGFFFVTFDLSYSRCRRKRSISHISRQARITGRQQESEEPTYLQVKQPVRTLELPLRGIVRHDNQRWLVKESEGANQGRYFGRIGYAASVSGEKIAEELYECVSTCRVNLSSVFFSVSVYASSKPEKYSSNHALICFCLPSS